MATKKPTKSQSQQKGKSKTSETKVNSQFMVIGIFALGLFLTAIGMIKGQNVWNMLHDLWLGLFGIGGLFIGPIFVYIAVLASLDKPIGQLKHKIWMIMVLVVLISGAIQVIGIGMPESQGGLWSKITEVYESGISLKGGGIASLLIGLPLYAMFGKLGASFTITLLIFLFVMIITGSTLAEFISSASKPVKKLEQVYTEKFEANSEEKKKPKFNIDIELDESDENHQVVTSPKGSMRKTPSITLDKSTSQQIPTTEKTPTIEEEIFRNLKSSKRNKVKNPLMDIIKGSDTVEPKKINMDIPVDIDNQDTIEGKSNNNKNHGELDDLINRAMENFKIEDNTDYDTFNFDDDSGISDDASSKKLPEHDIKLQNINDIDPFEKLPESMLDMEEEIAYTFPVIGLLNEVKAKVDENLAEELKVNSEKLVETLRSFGVSTKIVNISKGPSVTRYELQPAAGVKISKITNLADDIALNLAAAGVRIEAPIPNKPAVGIEVPNKKTDMVSIREIIDSKEFRDSESRLSVAMGKDIAGNTSIGDIAKMPHVLIAGATGSGKSVCINSIIISILYKASPDEVKLIMIDPKVVELGIYNGIPHLLIPVVTDPRKAAGALAWAVNEMTSRYNKFAENGARDIKGYNKLVEKSEMLQPMPQIVIIIDELADLMMAAPNEVEDSICRLAQMARAAGMHLVIATQRPSVDVITGVIKANIPSRVAFAVSSQVDSRTILDSGGAEKLLGKGDMLFAPVGSPKPLRVQGCFVSDNEVEQVVEFVKSGGNQVDYDENVMEEIERQAVQEKGKKGAIGDGIGISDEDSMFNEAVDCVMDAGQASTSYLQRRLKLGYARAARLMDSMEEQGIIGPPDGSKPRQVLMSKERWNSINGNID